MPSDLARPIRPFRHVLLFTYGGKQYKAIWFKDHTAAILRQLLHDVADDSADYEIVWSLAQGSLGRLNANILRYGHGIMQNWGWPRRLDIDNLVQ